MLLQQIRAGRHRRRLALLLLLAALTAQLVGPASAARDPDNVRGKLRKLKLSDERIVFQTAHGDIEMALYPEVAPKTVAHILKLASLGGYNTCNFFRVDKGFVAQVVGVDEWSRKVPLNEQQKEEAKKLVPLEVVAGVKHDRRGILSMARGDNPDSGGSSFSITLGAAPHLDMNYAIFGEVTKGLPTLAKFEELPTKTEGIFVMPLEPPVIQSSYVYLASEGPISCQEELADLKTRFDAQSKELHKIRASRLPG